MVDTNDVNFRLDLERSFTSVESSLDRLNSRLHGLEEAARKVVDFSNNLSKSTDALNNFSESVSSAGKGVLFGPHGEVISSSSDNASAIDSSNNKNVGEVLTDLVKTIPGVSNVMKGLEGAFAALGVSVNTVAIGFIVAAAKVYDVTQKEVFDKQRELITMAAQSGEIYSEMKQADRALSMLADQSASMGGSAFLQGRQGLGVKFEEQIPLLKALMAPKVELGKDLDTHSILEPVVTVARGLGMTLGATTQEFAANIKMFDIGMEPVREGFIKVKTASDLVGVSHLDMLGWLKEINIQYRPFLNHMTDAVGGLTEYSKAIAEGKISVNTLADSMYGLAKAAPEQQMMMISTLAPILMREGTPGVKAEAGRFMKLLESGPLPTTFSAAMAFASPEFIAALEKTGRENLAGIMGMPGEDEKLRAAGFSNVAGIARTGRYATAELAIPGITPGGIAGAKVLATEGEAVEFTPDMLKRVKTSMETTAEAQRQIVFTTLGNLWADWKVGRQEALQSVFSHELVYGSPLTTLTRPTVVGKGGYSGPNTLTAEGIDLNVLVYVKGDDMVTRWVEAIVVEKVGKEFTDYNS